MNALPEFFLHDKHNNVVLTAIDNVELIDASLFLSPDEIIDHIISEFDQNSKDYVVQMTDQDIGMQHHFWGMGIRNVYGMWMEQNPHTDIHSNNHRHPDQLSNYIMTAIRDKIISSEGVGLGISNSLF